MKPVIQTRSVIISLILIAIVSCKKQQITDSEAASLAKTTWLVTTEMLYFPNDELEIFTRNSVWYFLDDHKLKIFNPDSFIQEEKGEWLFSADKIIIEINNDSLWHYQRNYKIISKTDVYMRLSTQDVIYEMTDNGKTSEVQYILRKL